MAETPAQKYKKYGYGKGNWWYNTTSGEITHATGLQQIINVDGPGLSLAGPFPTKADAEAFKKANEPDNPVSTVVGGVKDTAQGLAKIGAFLEALTQLSTWASMGWVVMGVLMMIAGVYLWLKKADLIPQAVPVPV